MSKQQLTASSDISGKAKEEKPIPRTSKFTPANSQYTFYQSHLSQPPTDYMFLDDNPTLKTTHKLQTAKKVEQKSGTNINLQQLMPNKQRLESGASRKDSYDLSEDNPVLSVKSKLMEEWEVCQTQEKDSNESVRGSIEQIEPLSPRRCSLEGKFIPQTNHMPSSKIKPTIVERGYLFWQLQKTGDEVDHLETIMQRTVEQKLLEAGSENTTLERNV